MSIAKELAELYKNNSVPQIDSPIKKIDPDVVIGGKKIDSPIKKIDPDVVIAAFGGKKIDSPIKKIDPEISLPNATLGTDIASMQSIIDSFNDVQYSVDPILTEDDMKNASKITEKTSGYNPNVSNKDIEEMTKILGLFEDVAENTASNIIDDSEIDYEVYEALQTKKTNSGVSIGPRYEIKTKEINSISGSKKAYDIIDIYEKEEIATNLYLYEAAHAIVRLLNKGIPHLDPKIRRVIGLEESYMKNRHDASVFKQKYQKARSQQNIQQMDIYESRFEVSKSKALKIKDEIKGLL